MEVAIRAGAAHERRAGMAALFVYEGDRSPAGAAAAFDRASGGALKALLASGDLRGAALETDVLHPVRGARATRVLVTGLGRRDALTPPAFARAVAQAARRARAAGARVLAIDTTAVPDGEAWLSAAAEGAVTGHWAFHAYRATPSPPLRTVELVVADARRARALAPAVAAGRQRGDGVCLARDLAWTPGQDLVPEQLAQRAIDVAEATGSSGRLLRAAQLERLGLGCLLAVGRGSPHAPCLAVLERPAAVARKRGARVPTVVLAGKGITFDTGGLAIKPRDGMLKMKYDMSGAAAVTGVFAALPALELPFRVVGLLACAENMPGSRAMKPGDVLRAMDGTTVEVTNTDAEGRLVLADALCYARTLQPAAIVDIATLTGAARIALGSHAAGLFSPDDTLAGELLESSQRSGERVWRLPVGDEYAAELKSDTADVVNFAHGEGGASLAASFLMRFARGVPWAHLDIAPVAWSAADRGYEGRGPNGWGVRLLLEWLSAAARRVT